MSVAVGLDVNTEAALEFVNLVRFRDGLKPLDDLPKGTRSGYECPIAKAIPDCRYAYKTSVALTDGTMLHMPIRVKRWVEWFDRGLYPDYEVVSPELNHSPERRTDG